MILIKINVKTSKKRKTIQILKQKPKTCLKNFNSKEYIQPYVHCRIIYNYQDMEATQVSINSRVDKTTMGYLHNGMLLGHKEGNLILYDSMDGPGEHYAKWNKPARKR